MNPLLELTKRFNGINTIAAKNAAKLNSMNDIRKKLSSCPDQLHALLGFRVPSSVYGRSHASLSTAGTHDDRIQPDRLEHRILARPQSRQYPPEEAGRVVHIW